jgi:hypothetical protein
MEENGDCVVLRENLYHLLVYLLKFLFNYFVVHLFIHFVPNITYTSLWNETGQLLHGMLLMGMSRLCLNTCLWRHQLGKPFYFSTLAATSPTSEVVRANLMNFKFFLSQSWRYERGEASQQRVRGRDIHTLMLWPHRPATEETSVRGSWLGLKPKLRGFGPRANYTKRATSACWRS